MDFTFSPVRYYLNKSLRELFSQISCQSVQGAKSDLGHVVLGVLLSQHSWLLLEGEGRSKGKKGHRGKDEQRPCLLAEHIHVDNARLHPSYLCLQSDELEKRQGTIKGSKVTDRAQNADLADNHRFSQIHPFSRKFKHVEGPGN